MVIGYTPLMAAILQANTAVTDILLKRGAAVNYYNYTVNQNKSLSVFLYYNPLGTVLSKYLFLLSDIDKINAHFIVPINDYRDNLQEEIINNNSWARKSLEKMVNLQKRTIASIDVFQRLGSIYNQLISKGARFFTTLPSFEQEEFSCLFSTLLKLHMFLPPKLFINLIEELGEQAKEILKTDGHIWEVIAYSYDSNLLQYFIDNDLINFTELEEKDLNLIYNLLAYFPPVQAKIVLRDLLIALEQNPDISQNMYVPYSDFYKQNLSLEIEEEVNEEKYFTSKEYQMNIVIGMGFKKNLHIPK